MRINFVLNPIVMLFFITCCSSEKNSTDNLVCINISKTFIEKEIIITDIADVEYLYLSSDDDDYLYSGTITYMTKNTVVVYSRTSGDILFFSKDGKPKSRFNHKGQGPEDYINAMAVIYDEATDDVFVNRMRDILVYSSTGVYKRKITLPQGTEVDGRIISFDENSLFLYDLGKEFKREIRVLSGETDFVEEDNVTSFYRISKTDGELLDYVEIPYVPIFLGIYVDGQRMSSRSKRFLVKCPEGAFLCSLETDTIFLYRHDKSLTPVIYKTPSLTSTNPMKYLNNCLDRGQYQFIEVCTVQAGDEYPSVFPVTNYMRNKDTGEICCPKFLLPDYKGKEFIISPSNGFLYDSGVYFELDLFELKQAYHDNKLSGKLMELVASLNEDEDNNVFILVEFK